jgi:hypothetical protein
MRKLIYSIAILSLIFTSCGGGKDDSAESIKIDTKDVKGTIDAGDAKMGTTTLHNNDGEFDVPNFKMNGGGFMIAPTSRTFEEEWQLVESNLNGFGTFEMIDKTENSAIYKVIKDFAGKKTEGYNFVVWIKGDKTNYMIKGESENMFDPIEKKEDAESMLKVALTFKPE